MSNTVATAPVMAGPTPASRRHQFSSAWFIALTFYVLEYATRSAPAVMLPKMSKVERSKWKGVWPEKRSVWSMP